MTFTKTTQIALAIALQLVAVSAFSQTSFDIADLDGLGDVDVTAPEVGTQATYPEIDTIDVSVDGRGHYVGVSYDAGPRVGTDEYLGRSVWSVVVLYPGYKQVLVVTMDQTQETEIVNFLADYVLPELGGSMMGVTNLGENPDELVFTYIDEYTPDSYIELATENHVLIFSGMDPFAPSSYFDWDEDCEIEKVYVTDLVDLSVYGFESSLAL